MREAMEDFRFYHLTRHPLEHALPRFLEQVTGKAGLKVYLKCPDASSAETIDCLLWSYDPASFLPHGRVGEGREADQPVLIGWDDRIPENGAQVLVLVEAAALPDPETAGHFRRGAYLFDANRPGMLEAARAAWRAAADLAPVRSYWQQQERGGWAEVREQ
ncbi:MAG: DNA polymerase III subunit chi [Alphaproteobacteria bacterium]|nr:MAG: DNA polymerase III subunit chi [Alphaproteobacteria bacterium]